MTSTFASDKQIKLALALFDERVWTDKELGTKFVTRAAAVRLAMTWALESPSPEVSAVATAAEAGQRVNQIMAHMLAGGVAEDAAYAWAPVTGKSAYAMNSWLMSLPKKQVAPTAAPTAPVKQERVELEDGMYQFEGNIYKVQHAVHGSGNQYAKLAEIVGLDANGVPVQRDAESYSVSFSYAPGIVAKLRPEHKLTYEQAKAFGALYGTCCRCGKTLTDELSIALGIGPVCGGREFGGDFKAIIKAAKLELAAKA